MECRIPIADDAWLRLESFRDRDPRPGAFALTDLAHLDSGTLSLWRDTAAAAYAPGIHQSTVRAQRAGGWFSESWFARFGVEAASGSWRGLDVATLDLAPVPAATGD